MFTRLRVVLLVLIGLGFQGAALAQWTQQTIRLQPGWNAVYIEVEPQPRDCDTLFRGIPVESVWGWNRRFTSVQFVQDPNTLLPEEPRWLAYFPPSSPRADMTNLYIVQGGRPYLIKITGTQAVNLVVNGRPKIRPVRWLADSYNFVGFHLNSASPPTFSSFFASSPAHAGQESYRMSTTGRWQKITAPATDRMRAGEAYWVYCKGLSDFQGPLSVKFDVGDGLDYARILIEQTLQIKNSTAADRTVTLVQRNSNAPPGTSFPMLAGTVPLSYFKSDIPHKTYGWQPLSTPLALTVPANSELEVRLAVRRANMAPFTPPAGRDALYQCLLDVNNGAGSLLTVPVSARGMNEPWLAGLASGAGQRPSGGSSPGKFDALGTPANPRAGLWVGDATINAVSNPTSGSLNPRRPLPVAQPLSFPLIVHVDASGQPRFLQQVLQMWKEGAWIPNPADPTGKTFILDPSNTGRTVLLTNDSLIPRFTGVALRDVKLVGRRISSPAFGFRGPIMMSGGQFGVVSSNPTTCTITLDYQDPVNPFKHKYHPDHNNLDERFEAALPEGFESYTVVRSVSLQFTATDPEDLVGTGWGDEVLGGIYRETVLGIHRSAVYAEGTFRLQRISGVDILNDGLE